MAPQEDQDAHEALDAQPDDEDELSSCTVQGCDDRNECTVDGCEDGRCVNTPVAAGTPCDGGDLDSCNSSCSAAGKCVLLPVRCEQSQACEGIKECIPSTGECLSARIPIRGETLCMGEQLLECDGIGGI
ncbi:MAG: hypothetical protein RBU37_07645, partial [Myxococcota bacterium]|nr:hypothetical protein [Myxococcota bacterium]